MKHDALLLLVFEVVIRFRSWSPLHLSCMYTPYVSSREGRLEVCKCLIAAQADVNAKDHDGYDLNSMRIFYET